MKPKHLVRSILAYDTEQASADTAYHETMPSLTIQSQALDTDINEILRRVGLGAPMPQNLKLPEYGDYTGITDFRSALEAVQRAETEFMTLPAQIRATFQNDPQAFLEYVQQPANLDQLRTWGLAIPKPETKTDAKPTDTPPQPTETKASSPA